MSKSTPKLASALAACQVPKGSLALSWLGQAGFVFKSPGGTLLAIDPYLSNSCEALGKDAGFDMKRQVPAPITPQELVPFDALAFTHSHQDHVDPETIQPYLKAGGKGRLIAPHDASEQLLRLGADRKNITLVWPNHALTVGDFTLKTTFAIPFDGGDMTHVGYLIDVKGGPRFYFTGDTDYNEILSISVAPYQPDIMATVINPAFRNLSPREGATLAKAIQPKWVIPCHHDLFGDNCLPDRLLKTNLTLLGMTDAFCPLVQGEIRLFRKPKSNGKTKLPLI
jgi:L-ascorbate 6-phosphate lactonase